ncbi:Cytochrome c oxidase subunit 4 [Malassezia japonica]|uniref:Cytochrome c oxidase subunit 4, mitochondrial n=1 Tax=Malassezia japonica TaxID=223818 RepID=A0AAF0EZA4_9BASI|nr:Cytochrome c oxidase subunit 4 [Malassezia japonica]WFD37532.1 Cytochrome c oxidase subunit 4 [Malassezia japonica]
MSFLPSRLSLTARATLRAIPRAQASALRSIATSAVRLSEQPPIIQGSGSPTGTIPSDEDQSTGLERYELMGRLQGVDVFDMQPLEADRLGTKAEPVKVRSMYHEQIVGCTGVPVDSHETLWLNMSREKEFTRCPRCGSVYQLEFLGEEGHHHH